MRKSEFPVILCAELAKQKLNETDPCINGYILSTCDMSGSICRLNDVFCEKNVALIKKMLSILKAKNKYTGVSIGATENAFFTNWAFI